MKKNKYIYGTIAATTAITLATVGASTVSADTQYGIFLNRVTGEWQTVNHATGEIVKSEPNGTYSSYEEAQASLATSNVEAPVTTETPATETTAVEAPKTSADVKPALDAQQAVVDATAQDATKAQADVDAANQDVTTAQTDVDTATQAVKDAEANAANATPENIAAIQADQAANLADQAANATETDEVNAEIASQTATVADAQTAVDTAQAEKDAADANVTAKEADVKAAQDALSGTGLAEAQATLDQAKTDVKTAEANVTTATDAVATAKQADADRDAKIKAAETEVAVKSDAVDTAKAKLTAAQDAVTKTSQALDITTQSLSKAEQALAEYLDNNQNSFALAVQKEILDKTGETYFGDDVKSLRDLVAQFKELLAQSQYRQAQDYAERHQLGAKITAFLTNNSAEKHLSNLIGSDVLNSTITVVDAVPQMTFETYKSLNIVISSQVNAIRKLFETGTSSFLTEQSLVDGWNAQKLYQNSSITMSNVSLLDKGHYENVTNATKENLFFTATTYRNLSTVTFKELSHLVLEGVMYWLFEDAHSNFGHHRHTLADGSHAYGIFANNVSAAVLENTFRTSKSDSIVYKLYDVKAREAELTYWENVRDTFNRKFQNLRQLQADNAEAMSAIQNYVSLENTSYTTYTKQGQSVPVTIEAEITKAYTKAWEYLVINDADITANTILPGVNFNDLSAGYWLARMVPNVLFAMTKEYASSDRNNIAGFDDYGYLPYGAYATLTGNLRNTIPALKNAVEIEKQNLAQLLAQIPTDAKIATLQVALTKAQADQAQAASDAAKAQLTKASSDYATALEAKTQAEKVLAEATATPLQTQVAENNLRLAEIALQNAEARKADAQKAVDNFSTDLATKKAALDTAKTELAQAQATATAKAEALNTAKAELAKQQGTLDSLNKDKDALLAEKDRLVEEAKALAEELQGYLKAPAILANAQATLTEKQAALTEAQAKAETAQNKLETVTAKLAAEESKLAELQAEYNKLKDLEDKAKDNVIVTLPDGTIVAVPKDAPTAVEKPAINIDAVKDAITKGQDVTVVDGEVVVTNPQAGVTVTQTATGEKVTYSRAERAKTLPNTGEQTSLLALAGLTVLSSLGLVSARRRKQG
ncbi:LPXTG cell wall anchor domain-containing protein [Streptococcus suis]|uniref:LPXTG cell wall anchor domain-containing protein n=2 Tax=Streptococcus suis TaxID=1307 RepID=UPI002AAD3B5F|nr:LPXTG cell wall anchor domain-containing protein [Streptococcus suis]HEP1812908.1 LPXTG cell wall anchor domain-containing protein [Streptococcus suis]HEP1831382.1 LPXTG cell wall anchor domain-containing protein [Streptococcus suis]